MAYTDKKNLVKLVSYMSTFDGGLYAQKKNAKFIMNMRAENRDYMEWVKETLEEIVNVTINERKDYSTDGCNRAPQLRVESSTHPFLTKIMNRIYIDRKKVIDPHMLKLMDAEALAIIFMADGGTYLEQRFKNPSANVTLNTKGFSYHDNMALSKTIYDKLGIRTTVNRHNKYFYLRVKVADIVKFVDTVVPYVRNSFLYKLERIAPYIEYKGGDIVWSSQKCEEVDGDIQPNGEIHE